MKPAPRTKHPPARPAAPRHFLLVGGLLAVALIAGAISWRNRSHPAAAPVPPAVAPATGRFPMLPGRWLRPDGGYILEIRRVGADGTLEAGYLNPRPIHVAEASASGEAPAVRVFIKLQDVGYPGSTYTLVYRPSTDRLTGRYFQPAMGQTFEVEFTRLPAAP